MHELCTGGRHAKVVVVPLRLLHRRRLVVMRLVVMRLGLVPQKPLPVHRSGSDGVGRGLAAPMVPQCWLLIPPVLMLNAPGAVLVRGAVAVPRMALLSHAS